MYLGVKAVLAKSFERIHAHNLVNFGILPLTFVNPADYDKLDKNDSIDINDVIAALDNDQPIVIKNPVKGKIYFNCNLSARQKAIVKAGGLLNYTKLR
jgi:aconitate hydratase